MSRTLVAGALAMLLALPAGARAETLYDKFGGKPGMDKLAAKLVERAVHDPRIAASFEDTNLDRLRRMLSEQFCQVTDGGCTYTGHNMAEAHKGVHSTTMQFNALVEDLQDCMDELDIPFSTQNKLLARLAPMYRDVVTR